MKLSTYATTIRGEGLKTIVRYHRTDIVTFDPEFIKLDTGGWGTVTTKRKMNQASAQYGLGYHVFQKDYTWYVDVDGVVSEYIGDIFIIRREK